MLRLEKTLAKKLVGHLVYIHDGHHVHLNVLEMLAHLEMRDFIIWRPSLLTLHSLRVHFEPSMNT